MRTRSMSVPQVGLPARIASPALACASCIVCSQLHSKLLQELLNKILQYQIEVSLTCTWPQSGFVIQFPVPHVIDIITIPFGGMRNHFHPPRPTAALMSCSGACHCWTELLPPLLQTADSSMRVFLQAHHQWCMISSLNV